MGEGGQRIGAAARHDVVHFLSSDREGRSHPGLEERPWLVALEEDAEEGVAAVDERHIPRPALNTLRQTDHRKRERDRLRIPAGGAVRSPASNCWNVPAGEAQRPVFANATVPRPSSSVSRKGSRPSISRLPLALIVSSSAMEPITAGTPPERSLSPRSRVLESRSARDLRYERASGRACAGSRNGAGAYIYRR